ncbi:hypothetical protein, partial [Kingella kingae]|uniref:hypothetical protein n=1 Tax=Kingella kingae TaxID=504 RepID=UPI001EE1D74B
RVRYEQTFEADYIMHSVESEANILFACTRNINSFVFILRGKDGLKMPFCTKPPHGSIDVL